MRSKIVILLSALLLVAACKLPSEQQAAKILVTIEAQNVNRMLAGKNVDYCTVLDSCTFDGKNIIYYYKIDEDIITSQEIENNKNILETNIIETWKASPQLKVLKRNLNILDGSAIYKYTGSISNHSFSITIKPPVDDAEEPVDDAEE